MSKISSLLVKKAATLSRNSFRPQRLHLQSLQTPVLQTPSKWIKKDKYLELDQRIQSYPDIASCFFANSIVNGPSRMCCLSRIVLPRSFLIRMQIMNNDIRPESKFNQVLCPSDGSNTTETPSAIYYPNSIKMLENLNNKDTSSEKEFVLEAPYYPSSVTRKDIAYIKKTKDVVYKIKLDQLQNELESIRGHKVDANGDVIYLCFKSTSDTLFNVTRDSESSCIKTSLNVEKLFNNEPYIYDKLIEILNPLKKDSVIFRLNDTTYVFTLKLVDFALFME